MICVRTILSKDIGPYSLNVSLKEGTDCVSSIFKVGSKTWIKNANLSSAFGKLASVGDVERFMSANEADL